MAHQLQAQQVQLDQRELHLQLQAQLVQLALQALKAM
jgi:hypothetical protein